MKIGFIGLGIMGKPMAINLINAGHELVVHNRSQSSVQELANFGAHPAVIPAEIGSQCEVIITMLPDSPDVHEAICGENGVLSGIRGDAIIIDMSSISPVAAIKIAERCKEHGVIMLDAPVSGGEAGAIAGTLTIMVGGDEASFRKLKDNVLLKMGMSATYCGPVGAGNTAKLANQIIVACYLAAYAEAFTLAKKSGVNPHLVFQAIQDGFAGGPLLNIKAPMMFTGNYKPGFKLDLHIKDLHNSLDTACKLGVPLPLTGQIAQMMQVLQSDGFGGNDHSVIAEYYTKVTGISLNP